jgi:hypothetical protein
MTPKRKATHVDSGRDFVVDATASAPKRPRTVRTMATKEPRRPPPSIVKKVNTKITVSASLLKTRPWLTRPQQISEQDLWILHGRDNLVPGATGPKDWHVLAGEFNKHFKDELKKPLAYNTLSKRCGSARKAFLKNNPEYAGVCVYPVPAADTETDGDSDTTNLEDNVGVVDTKEQVSQHPPNFRTPNVRDVDSMPHPQPYITTKPTNTPPTSLPSSPPTLGEQASGSDVNTPLPGSFNPSTVQDNYIPPITRAKFHLRHRTNRPVTFHFSDPHENNLTKDDPQYVDADILTSVSPFYARQATEDLGDTVINVPAHIGTPIINIFVQLVSPERANELPTHYLWKAKKPTPGVYDRYGAISAEKIVWSVDTLLDLLLFAQWMEVYWIVDMVIDRLHYLFTEQAKYKDTFAAMGTPSKGYINVGGRQVFIGSQLPPVKNMLANIAAEDFEEDFMSRLAKLSVRKLVWRFLADVIYALGGEVEGAGWLTAVSEEVQQIFFYTEEKYLDAATTRKEFCARYHHHALGSDACYTSHSVHPVTRIIDILYSSSTPQEQVRQRDGISSANSFADILYTNTGDVSGLGDDDSIRTILEAEKMLLKMESRLHEAKNAVSRARQAIQEESKAATDEASRIVRTMFSHAHCSA